MLIYNDNVLIQTIISFCKLLKEIDISILFQYLKVAKTIVHLFKVICEQHFESFLIADQSFSINILSFVDFSIQINERELIIDSIDILNGICNFIIEHQNEQEVQTFVQLISESLRKTSLIIWKYAINTQKEKLNVSSCIRNILQIDTNFIFIVQEKLKSITDQQYYNIYQELVSNINSILAESPIPAEKDVNRIISDIHKFVEEYTTNRYFS